MGQIGIERRDIHFGIVAHAAIVQVRGADGGPEIVDNRDFGVHIDRAIVLLSRDL